MTSRAAHVVCIGAACIDRKYRLAQPPVANTSNPSRMERAFGGVARNVAENLARLGVSVELVSTVGSDESGAALRAHLNECGAGTAHVRVREDAITSEYAAIIDPAGELAIGVCDAYAIDGISQEDLRAAWPAMCAARWVFADCNLAADVLAACIEGARTAPFKLAIDGVSEAKVRKLPADLHGLDLLFVNAAEAAAYLGAPAGRASEDENATALVARGATSAVVTLGPRGLIVAADRAFTIAAARAACVDETGAGDALVAGTLYALLQGQGLAGAVQTGCATAALTIESFATVLPEMSARVLAERLADAAIRS